MRYAIQQPDDEGYVLLEGDAPFPEGAIAPIRNWNDLISVPSYFITSDGAGGLREMVLAEKNAWRNAHLDADKLDRVEEIDAKTAELISKGFEYPASSGNIFSMSQNAQINWAGLLATFQAGLLALPITVITADDQTTYSIVDEADLLGFVGAALAHKNTYLQGGLTLKSMVTSAVDAPALDTIADNRV